MAKPGPRPTPTRILQQRGSRWAKGRTGEPTPPNEAPSCPKILDAEARAEWRRVVPLLRQLGILAKADRSTLAGYCAAWSQWCEAQRVIAAEGAYYVTPSGQKKRHPASIAKAEAERMMIRFGNELGLSPASRTRINAEQQAEAATRQDRLEAFLAD